MKPVCRIAALAALLLSTTLFAQTAAPTRPVGSIAGHTGWPVAKAEDVKSPEAILNAVYSVISGGKGQARDWDRMRSLFVPDARLIPVSLRLRPMVARRIVMPSCSVWMGTLSAAAAD